MLSAINALLGGGETNCTMKTASEAKFGTSRTDAKYSEMHERTSIAIWSALNFEALERDA
jgi:hypothetical protein